MALGNGLGVLARVRPANLGQRWAVSLPTMLCQLRLAVDMFCGVLRHVPSSAGLCQHRIAALPLSPAGITVLGLLGGADPVGYEESQVVQPARGVRQNPGKAGGNLGM